VIWIDGILSARSLMPSNIRRCMMKWAGSKTNRPKGASATFGFPAPLVRTMSRVAPFRGSIEPAAILTKLHEPGPDHVGHGVDGDRVLNRVVRVCYDIVAG